MLSERATPLHSSKPTRCFYHPPQFIQAQPSLSDLLPPSERVAMSIRGHISQLPLLFVYSLRQGLSPVLLHICMGPVPQQAFNKRLLNEWIVTLEVQKALYIGGFCLFVFVLFDTGDWTEGLTHAGQVVYPETHARSYTYAFKQTCHFLDMGFRISKHQLCGKSNGHSKWIDWGKRTGERWRQTSPKTYPMLGIVND